MGKENLVDINYKYFEDNFSEITKGHIGQYVVIKDCSVIGYYVDEFQAIEEMEKRGVKLGEYIVQQCLNNIDDNMVHYYSRVF